MNQLIPSYLHNIVEYIEDNKIQTAFVLSEENSRLKLIHSNRKETSLPASRILAWLGPRLESNLSKEAICSKLEEIKKLREDIANKVNVQDIWELAQGELEIASPTWLTELVISNPSINDIAAVSAKLLNSKAYFKFNNNNFEIYNAEFVEQKIKKEQELAAKKEFFNLGTEYYKKLFDLSKANKKLSEIDTKNSAYNNILLKIIENPEDNENLPNFKELTKQIPADNFLALKLAEAANLVPKHYNYWLPRSGYAIDDWQKDFAPQIEQLNQPDISQLTEKNINFVSIDSKETKDVDDAFYLEKQGENYHLYIAIACPSLNWDFGSDFDKYIFNRASSLYLLEGTYHLLPEELSTQTYSLLADNKYKPALIAELIIDKDGLVQNYNFEIAKIKIQENLNYTDVQNVLSSKSQTKHSEMLNYALDLAQKRLDLRIANKAVIIENKEVNLELKENYRVELLPELDISLAQLIVSEFMILINENMAKFATENNITMLFRTQNLNLPDEFAGVWKDFISIAKIVKNLSPAILELEANIHKGLGVNAYCTASSPLRRYVDLINQSQILAFIQNNQAKFSYNELKELLVQLNPRIESVVKIQRYRDRYWKLEYLAQNAQNAFDATVTEVTDNFYTFMLNDIAINVKAKRNQVKAELSVGQIVQVKLYKIDALQNELSVKEVLEIKN